MSKEFKMEFLNKIVEDKEYETYLIAWTHYYELCERYDRQILKYEIPVSSEEQAMMSANAKCVRKKVIDPIHIDNYEKWRSAKLEACRIVDQAFKHHYGELE